MIVSEIENRVAEELSARGVWFSDCPNRAELTEARLYDPDETGIGSHADVRKANGAACQIHLAHLPENAERASYGSLSARRFATRCETACPRAGSGRSECQNRGAGSATVRKRKVVLGGSWSALSRNLAFPALGDAGGIAETERCVIDGCQLEKSDLKKRRNCQCRPGQRSQSGGAKLMILVSRSTQRTTGSALG